MAPKSASGVLKRPASGGLKRPAGANPLTSSNIKKHNKGGSDEQSDMLEAKIKMFQAKGIKADIKEFLQGLSEAERQVVWKRFEYDRKTLPEAESKYKEIATGAGSMAKRENLLKAFIHGGCSVKCKYYQDLVITYQKELTWTHEESWKPYQFMVTQYGAAELMRRVKNGSIVTRKDEYGEWEFKFVENKDRYTEKTSGKFTGTSSGGLDSNQ